MRGEMYNERPAIQKVPVLAVPLKHRNVLKPGEKRVLMLGSTLARDIARDKDFQKAEAEFVPGSDDPASALAALKKMPAESLNGAILAINFGAQMFEPGAKLEQLTKATDEILELTRANNMRVVMGTPLHTSIYIGSQTSRFGNMSKEQQKASDDLRKKYADYLATQYQAGNVHALVGIGLGMTRSHLESFSGNKRVDKLNYYKNTDDLSEGLTEEGTYHCASAMIDGINMANGECTGETSADFEMLRYGSGVAYDPEKRRVIDEPATARNRLEQRGKTVELIPGYEKRPSLSTLPATVRTSLWSLCILSDRVGMGAEIPSGQLDYHFRKAESDVNNMEDGKEKNFALEQLQLTKASIYYGRAIWAAFKGRNSDALKLVDEAVEKNRQYLNLVNTNPSARLFAARLKDLQKDMIDGYSYLGFDRKKTVSDVFEFERPPRRPGT